KGEARTTRSASSSTKMPDDVWEMMRSKDTVAQSMGSSAPISWPVGRSSTIITFWPSSRTTVAVASVRNSVPSDAKYFHGLLLEPKSAAECSHATPSYLWYRSLWELIWW